MLSTEYFPGDRSGAYPLMLEASVPIDEHPLSTRDLLLPPDTRYAQIRTYLADPDMITPENADGRAFVEETQPTHMPRGPIVAYSDYEEVLRTQAVDRATGRTVPLPADDWTDHPETGWLFSGGTNLNAHVEVPHDPQDHQIRATLFYGSHTPLRSRRVDGITFAERLQDTGFAPGTFRAIRTEAEAHKLLMDNAVEQGRAIYTAMGIGDHYDLAKVFATGMMDNLFRYANPISGVDRVVRTSRHRTR